MNVADNLIKLIDSMNEKKDILLKLNSGEDLSKYTISEIHTIQLIGTLSYPNVSKIAEGLSMTRGGVSKLIKRLINDGAILPYQLETNQKEIYYKLTEKGIKVYEEHEKRHAITGQNDMVFFSKVDRKDIETILNFFHDYNDYLEQLIGEKTTKEDIV